MLPLTAPCGVPCRGRKPAGFSSFCESHIPDAKHIPNSGRRNSGRQAEYRHAECPAGGENPQGFHPFVNHISPMRNISPILVEGTAAGRQNTVMRSAPAGGENPSGFHPFANHFRCESYPDSGRGISGRQAEYPLMAAVLPLRARNAAIRGYSACRELCRIGER
ncbi:MAG: hypothetical protein LBK61_02645 [Spirochaetaceae bacterium]|nr:hypothetical protein [Spirochaetaceae bacterium]